MSHRKSVSWLALALAAVVAGCDSDSTVAATENPDEDQALSLSVLGARGDTLAAAVENEIVDTGVPPDLVTVPREPAGVTATAPALAPAVVRPAPLPQQQTRKTTQSVPPPARVLRADRPARVASEELAPVRTRERDVESRPARGGTIPSGATLSLVTAGSVCNEDAAVGSTIRAILTDAIRGSNGAVIPEGAQAVGEITSIDKWGAGIGVRIKSVRVDGRSYPVSSRVGYVLPVSSREGTCIPRRARVDVETKAPIGVAVN
ncbi:MAG TPA: hypothetical protein VF042_04145 [Gemmatimonadaceae bacterium]